MSWIKMGNKKRTNESRILLNNSLLRQNGIETSKREKSYSKKKEKLMDNYRYVRKTIQEEMLFLLIKILFDVKQRWKKRSNHIIAIRCV